MRVVACDLECTSLSGMIGRVLVGCVKDILPPEYGSGEIRTYRADSSKYRSKDTADDAELVKAIRDDLLQANLICWHNGKDFDRKFLNARLLKAGEDPLPPKHQIDTMWLIRSHLRASAKLDNIQQFLGLPDEKTPISWDEWMRGAAMNKKAIDSIVEHCEQDVIVLEQAYWKLLPLLRVVTRA